MDVNEEFKFLRKFKKKKFFFFFFFLGGGGVWDGLGGQGGCEQRIEVFWGGSGGGVGMGGGGGWVDVIEELEFLGKFTKKNWGG